MHVVVYGAKSFILENATAAQILTQAGPLKMSGDDQLARQLLQLAVQVESGSLDEIRALAETQVLFGHTADEEPMMAEMPALSAAL